MATIIGILQFFIVLSVLILAHEFGHYWMARRAGIWVEEFGFGLPPRAWGKKIGETLYSLNWLPFGGFVRLHGESNEDGVTKPDRAFVNKSKKARISIIVAGVVMNFILALVAFSITYSFTGIPRQTGNVEIVEVTENSPASEVGLVVGDILVDVEGTVASSTEEFISLVGSTQESTSFTILRGEESFDIEMTPRTDPPEGEGMLGVVISSSETYYPPLWQRPFYGMYYGFLESIFWTRTVLSGFGFLFSSLFSGQVPEGIAGPVGIYAITTQAAEAGILTLINFVGILSVNLAVLNIMPFPALDGGRLIFILLEGVVGKKVLPKVESYVHMAGMILLLGLLLAITVGDIYKLVQAGSISGFIDSFSP